jgi:hypothetical protein
MQPASVSAGFAPPRLDALLPLSLVVVPAPDSIAAPPPASSV